MPEGDTIFRAARTLELRLGGKRVTGFHTTVPELGDVTLEGVTVAKVEARGKNLLMSFDDGRVLATHMMMVGSWHVYRPGERWQKPRHYARLVLETSDCVAVCFSAPVVELHASQGHVEHARLNRLGPDILSDTFDVEAAVTSILGKPALPLGETLLDQSLLCGIGNVYKSEALFLEHLSPFVPSASVPRPGLVSLVARARVLMRQNLAPGAGMRTTRFEGGSRYWVYLRADRPCLVCGAVVRMRRQGNALRSTYFCRPCQNVT